MRVLNPSTPSEAYVWNKKFSMEAPRIKNTFFDFEKFKDAPQGFHHGLWQDVRNNFNFVYGPASVLADPEEVADISPAELAVYKEKLQLPLLTYREYLERNYTPEAVEAIVTNPGSDAQQIEYFDALIHEYNRAIKEKTLTPQYALDIYHRAIDLLKGGSQNKTEKSVGQ